MSEPLKLDTDNVILRNKTNDSRKRTLRLYADRKIKQHPKTYEIIEVCQKETLQMP